MAPRRGPGGQWQGSTCVAAPTGSHARGAADWLLLDTGGTGGGFGQGKPHANLQDVHFWDRRNGVAIGYSGLFRTTDGGLAWRERPLAPVVSADGEHKGTNWYSVRMAGPREIWALGQIHPGGIGRTTLRRSTDDGFTWTDVLRGKLGHATRLHFRGPFERWVICRWPTSFHSADAGHTWRPVDWGTRFVPRDICFPGDVRLATGAVGYVVGHRRGGSSPPSVILKSVDTGRTWKDVTPPDCPPVPVACSFVSSWRGWVLGCHGIAATDNGGRTWHRRPAPPNMVAMRFFQTGHGWVAGGGGFRRGRLTSDWSLCETTDGARTWQPVLGGWKRFRSVCSLGPGTGWAVGSAVGFIGNDLVAVYDRARRP